MPVDSVIQFSLLASPYIDNILAENKLISSLNSKGSMLRAIMDKRTKFLENLRDSSNDYNLVRNFSLIVTIMVPCSNHIPAENEFHKMEQLLRVSGENLKTVGLSLKALDNNSFIEQLGPFFNSHNEASWHNAHIQADVDIPLVNQLMDYDANIKTYEDHLEIGGYYVNTLSVKRFPDFVSFGQACRYAGDLITGVRGIHVPFIISGTIIYPDQQKMRTRINAQRQWTINQAYGPLVKFLPRLALKKKGFDIIYQEIENGEKTLSFNLTISTFAKNYNESQSVVSSVRTYFREMGFAIMPDKYSVLPIFINSLPFGADPIALKSLYRFKTLTSKFILPLLPIFADGKGTGTGAFNLISRHGQLMNVSIYDSSTNYNLCIAAQSGSGKSFLVNEIIVSYLAMQSDIYVIDVGRSYKNICELLGGSFMSFGMDAQISLNPFSSVRDYAEEADMLVSILTSMCAPTEKLSDFQNAELKRITGELFLKYSNKLTIDIVADTMIQNTDSRVRDMGIQLYPFRSNGEYGKFFMGTNELSFNNSFTVLELEELKGRKHLQQVVLLELIYQIQQNMYLGQRNRKKLVIIDEAWDLLREGNVANFIETGYRRFRKYGGAAITVTQSVNDLYNSEIGRAIVENSANMYLLGQKADAINLLAEQKRLPLTDGEYQYLKTVHTVAGKYSEIFLITSMGNAIGRLIVDPFRMMLYSTTAQDVENINNLRKQGYSIVEAINRLIAHK